jgi:hypothetical protein
MKNFFNDGTKVALNRVKQSCYENVRGGGHADDKRAINGV